MEEKGKTRRDPRTHAIIGAAMEVHRELGPGFLESAYHEALALEFAARQIPFEHEKGLPIYYKGELLKTIYRADFFCYDSVVVEVKAQRSLTGNDEAQVINYLKATHGATGLLLNFGTESLQYRRFIFSQSAQSAQSADGAFRNG